MVVLIIQGAENDLQNKRAQASRTRDFGVPGNVWGHAPPCRKIWPPEIVSETFWQWFEASFYCDDGILCEVHVYQHLAYQQMCTYCDKATFQCMQNFLLLFRVCVCVCVCMFWFPNVYVAASGSAWSSGRGGKWCTFGLVMHMTKGFSTDARASCTLNFGTCSFWARESNWERAARSRIEQDSAPLVFRCTIKLSTEIRWYINNERGPKPLPGKEDTVTPGSRDFCIHPGTPLFRAFHVQIGTAKCLSPSSVH